jgi:broad specificity phosphatase PhoE
VTRFLFLVRHGEAPGDGELSEAGREQARLTGERLRDVPFGGICGPQRAAAALERFARPGGPDGDEYELVVTHNFLAGWLVSQAMAGPPWRWLGVNQMNCAISVIAYQAGLPASLLTFNDAGHLSPELRWTGFPPALRF